MHLQMFLIGKINPWMPDERDWFLRSSDFWKGNKNHIILEVSVISNILCPSLKLVGKKWLMQELTAVLCSQLYFLLITDKAERIDIHMRCHLFLVRNCFLFLAGFLLTLFMNLTLPSQPHIDYIQRLTQFLNLSNLSPSAGNHFSKYSWNQTFLYLL